VKETTTMTRTVKLALASALLAAAAGALILTRDGDGRADAEPPPAPRLVVAPGTVEAASERIDLAFEQAGRVTEVLVAEGERVAAGQLLARLDGRLARARVARAEAALASAEARRDLALRGARREEIRAARAEAEAARATARDRRLSRERASKLLADEALSAAEADSAEAAATAAGGQASAAEARLALLERGTRSEEKREAIAHHAAAAAELEEARVLLAQSELRAPRAGTVLRRFVEPGEAVVMMPPTVVLALADLSQVQLRAEIDETDVGRVRAGQRGFATAQALGDARIPGRVARLTHELGRKLTVTDDPRARIDTRVLEVIFVPDAGHPELPLGLRMDVQLEDAAASVAQM
jgi:multidrug resistance efflux pump